MFNEIIGIFLADKYNITTDKILFTVSVLANDTSVFSIADAVNGAKLKADLTNTDYFITNYSIWSQNGILDVTIKPDNEPTNQMKTAALTKQITAPILPPKYIQTDISVEVVNNQAIDDDLFLALDIFKIPQSKVNNLIDIGKNICISPYNIDIQTLAIEKYIIYTNELLKALILANNGSIPGEITGITTSQKQATSKCMRT